MKIEQRTVVADKRVMAPFVREIMEERCEESHQVGLKKGLNEGCEEQRIKIALEMIRNSIDEQTISKCTQLTLEQLKNLKNGVD